MNVEKAIWSAYLPNPCRAFSIRELALHLNKSYPLIHQHVSRLISQKKLLSKTVGKSILCYPNYNHGYTVLSLALAQENQLQQHIVKQPHLLFLHQYFSSQAFPGLLSVWQTDDALIVFLADTSYQESIEFALSKTTLNQKVMYMSYADKSSLVNALTEKTLVLFGHAQFHMLIRLMYESYASKYNMVKLHE